VEFLPIYVRFSQRIVGGVLSCFSHHHEPGVLTQCGAQTAAIFAPIQSIVAASKLTPSVLRATQIPVAIYTSRLRQIEAATPRDA